MILFIFLNILPIFTDFMVMFRDLLAILLFKVFKSKIETAQKITLLECLFFSSDSAAV